MSSNHQQDMHDYFSAKHWGTSNGSAYGNLGQSAYDAARQKASQKAATQYTSPTPSSAASSSYSGSVSSSTYTGGSGGGSTFDEFISLSDWLFDPIDDLISGKVASVISTITAIFGALMVPLYFQESSWVSIGIGGVVGFLAPAVTYIAARLLVSTATIAAILAAGAAILYLVVHIVLAFLE